MDMIMFTEVVLGHVYIPVNTVNVLSLLPVCIQKLDVRVNWFMPVIEMKPYSH